MMIKRELGGAGGWAARESASLVLIPYWKEKAFVVFTLTEYKCLYLLEIKKTGYNEK